MVFMRIQTPVVPRPSGARTPTTRPTIGSIHAAAPSPLLGLEIPLYAQPAISSPAIYRLAENGRAFLLYSKDLHRSHEPLRNKGQKAIAPEHPLTRSQSEPQFGPPHILAHPLGHIQRRTVWKSPERAQEGPPPSKPPPPVEFSFDPWAEDALRRSIPPPLEPEPPLDVMPGFAKSSRSFTPLPASPKEDLPLPKLLRDIGYQGASTDHHTQSLVKLFARHERAMLLHERAMRDEVVRPETRMRSNPLMFRPGPQQSEAPKRETKSRNRLTMEREEMAMRRKLLLRPQSLTL